MDDRDADSFDLTATTQDELVELLELIDVLHLEVVAIRVELCLGDAGPTLSAVA